MHTLCKQLSNEKHSLVDAVLQMHGDMRIHVLIFLCACAVHDRVPIQLEDDEDHLH